MPHVQARQHLPLAHLAASQGQVALALTFPLLLAVSEVRLILTVTGGSHLSYQKPVRKQQQCAATAVAGGGDGGATVVITKQSSSGG